jgi:5-methylcytosine-specific restriction endonuclease McrA
MCKWRDEIFKRDNYTCVKCGDSIGGNLEAHHKQSFSILFHNFINTFNQFSPIEDKETLLRIAITHKPFYNLDNGETLCLDCHKKTDNYGRKKSRDYFNTTAS